MKETGRIDEYKAITEDYGVLFLWEKGHFPIAGFYSQEKKAWMKVVISPYCNYPNDWILEKEIEGYVVQAKLQKDIQFTKLLDFNLTTCII